MPTIIDQNINHTQLISFFEDLGESSIHVKSTFRWNVNEIKGTLRDGVSLPLMAIDSPHITENGTEVTNTNDLYNCALTFLGLDDYPTNRFDEYENQEFVINHNLEIAKKFRNKLLALSETAYLDGDVKNWLYGRIKNGSFQFLKVGPAYTENLYGYRLQFQINLKPTKTVVDTDWE
jgi:hypothetical protein